MGTPVTEETIKSWYDPKKKGIIVVGMMRSGTQFLLNKFHDVVTKINPRVDFYGEIPLMHSSQLFTAPNTMVPKIITEFTWCDNYSMSSVVLPQILPWMFNYWPNYEIIEKDYTVVKITRTDIMQHLMSTVIFNMGHRHSGITPDELTKLVDYPVELSVEELTSYILHKQYVNTIPADYTVNYEDLNLVSKHMVKNDYGVSPAQFFTNYDFIKTTIETLIFHHGK